MAQKSNQITLYRDQDLNQNQNRTNLLSLRTLIQNGSPYQGNLSSPVTIIDFSDFQCYLCNRYVKNTEPLLNETYVQTGKVALVFKNLPNRGFDSMGAAIAAQCTNDQGKFWQFHNLLYGNQKPIDSGWVNKENLKKFASEIPGLDTQKFNSCLDGEKYKTSIQHDIDLAMSVGFKETPSFIIVNSDGSNPEFLQGALPFPSFRAVIDKRLS
jgi:protein-disulfide isomerase